MPEIDSLEALRKSAAGGVAHTFRFFWTHRAPDYGGLTDAVFSQWWPCAFRVDGVDYSSAEQFMMAGKARLFGDAASAAKILAVRDPDRCKQLGRQVAGFDEAVWERARLALVTAGSVAKFGQDGRLRKYLLETGDAILAEASPTDCIWGIGLTAANPLAQDPAEWRGLNLLGFALMSARAQLRAAPAVAAR